ncbi:MAG: 16S rRNA (guanine(527)-N(7))-methyltransferase RsmG [Boseongicola sp.]
MNSGREAFLAAANVSRETTARMDTYAALLAKWSSTINLASRGSLDQIWTRHFADSAQVIDFATNNYKKWVDVGSGGGFPGAVVAILAAEKNANQSHTLVEADQRKAAFLTALSRETGVRFTVRPCRVEELEPQAADVVSARALAPLPKLLEYASKHLAPDGIALFFKGRRFAEEVANAKKAWSFHAEVMPSVTDKEAAILKIGDIERV